jgi:hypothetical protein
LGYIPEWGRALLAANAEIRLVEGPSFGMGFGDFSSHGHYGKAL